MTIVFTGGGTLGSVTPLLALFETLTPKTAYWIGTYGGIERTIIQEAHIRFFPILAGKLRRYFDWRTFIAPLLTIIGFVHACIILLYLRPTLVCAAGGYVQVPVIFAAWILGIPSFTLQLDVRPGLANRLVRPFVRTVFVAFPESARYFPHTKVLVTGSLVRKAFQGTTERTIARRPQLFVIGGGTGAHALNAMIQNAIEPLSSFCDIVHLTGEGKGRARTAPHYTAHTSMTHELPLALARADVVLTRGGMGVLSELAALSKAAIVVPLPETAQEENAALLARHGAAIVIEQKEMTPQKLVSTVRELLHDTVRRNALGACFHTTLPTNGGEIIMRILQTSITHTTA